MFNVADDDIALGLLRLEVSRLFDWSLQFLALFAPLLRCVFLFSSGINKHLVWLECAGVACGRGLCLLDAL